MHSVIKESVFSCFMILFLCFRKFNIDLSFAFKFNLALLSLIQGLCRYCEFCFVGLFLRNCVNGNEFG